MEILFHKYQGTGNDFIMIDNRNLSFPKDNIALIQNMCDRKFGIGADGLILLELDNQSDFKMVYYNADGRESTMCGNGGRCIVQFAHDLNLIKNETIFNAIDGQHQAFLTNGLISLQMINVEKLTVYKDGSIFLNTGSPHHITLVENIDQYPLYDFGKKIRYSQQYAPNGTNVNIVEPISNTVYKVRTYERGVENETLSCGTGATATAIAMHFTKKTNQNQIEIRVPGGTLYISFETEKGIYKNVYLKGKATFVFKGIWKI